MKYGDTLRQRSIPEWVYYNINYDEIKHLIKENTGSGKAKAVSIPGQGRSAEREFETTLYSILCDENENIGLFVKSKSLEIQHRLEHLDRKLRQLQLRANSGPHGPRQSRPEKYGRLEQEAIKAGDEIRSLSRFIGAQRLAFTKLLKKYKKWTGSDALAVRFRSEVLSRPENFTNISLSSQLDDWTDVLQVIRAAGNPDLAGKPNGLYGSPRVGSPLSRPSGHLRPRESSASIANRLEAAVSSGDDVDFDAAFADAPIGKSGAKAVYWIHQEQLIELQVVLLQHARLYLPKSASGTSSSSSQSPVATRKSSSARQDGQIEKEEDCGVIILDELDDYAQRQSRSTVSDSEDSTGRSFAKPKAIARWAAADEAVILLRQPKGETNSGTARVKKKQLGALLNVDHDSLPWKTCDVITPVNEMPRSELRGNFTPEEAREMLKRHREVRPLVGILSKRTRFIGLANSLSAGQWCVLDSSISISRVSQDDLVGKQWAANISQSATNFPYAVLEVRQEGKLAKSVIELLDKSHLTERVRGFSLASHAIWECWKPKSMSPPFWLPVLARDIRKLPEAVPKMRRSGSQLKTTPNQTSTTSDDHTGSSTAVATGESSVTSIPTTPTESREFSAPVSQKKQRRVTYHQEALLKHQAKVAQSKSPRYWSEYDHPEDGSGDENAYYLYVDPDSSDRFLGQKTAQKLYYKLKDLFNKDKQPAPADEENCLLSSPHNDEEDSSTPTDTAEDAPKARWSRNRSYGTAAPVPGQKKPARKFSAYKALADPASSAVAPAPSSSYRLLITSLTLAASAVICIILATLAATGRKRQRGEVDAGILFGVVASLFFALVGMVSVVTSRERVGMISWLIVSLVFIAVCIADGMLIGWIV